MSHTDSDAGRPGHGIGQFTTTHWSVVVSAGRSNATIARQALETLCRSYWYPLYAFVRRQGYSVTDAEDLTQGFFARLLARNYLGRVAREKGKFRSFLLAALGHYLSDERDRARALKRGGGKVMLWTDTQRSEERYRHAASEALTPEYFYERQWALTLLERAQERLREEYHAAHKVTLFEQLKPYAAGEKSTVPWETMAAQMGLTESALKSFLHRLRRRYRQLVREEVAQTVAEPREVDEEIRHLITVVGG